MSVLILSLLLVQMTRQLCMAVETSETKLPPPPPPPLLLLLLLLLLIPTHSCCLSLLDADAAGHLTSCAASSGTPHRPEWTQSKQSERSSKHSSCTVSPVGSAQPC